MCRALVVGDISSFSYPGDFTRQCKKFPNVFYRKISAQTGEPTLKHTLSYGFKAKE